MNINGQTLGLRRMGPADAASQPGIGCRNGGACLCLALSLCLSAPALGQESETNTAPVTPAINILHCGPFDLFPKVAAGVTYDDNIFIRDTNPQSDLVWLLSPGFELAAGDYNEREISFASIKYAPAFVLFTDHSVNDAIDHDASLQAQWHPARVNLGLQQRIGIYSGSLVEAGNRVDRRLYDTELKATSEISPKTGLEFVGTQSINDYESFNSFNEWTAAGWLNYSLTEKTHAGAGVTAGFVDNLKGANQTYQQGLVRMTYQVAGKVDLRGSAGAEMRQFEDDPRDRLDGIFSLGLTYHPLERTEIKLDAFRRTQSSVALTDQDYTITSLSAGLRQGFLAKYAATLDGGYNHLDYLARTTSIDATRIDDYFFVRLGLQWQATDRALAGVYYQYRKNDSNDAFSFENNQLGVNASYRF
jgi:hypothetical protein